MVRKVRERSCLSFLKKNDQLDIPNSTLGERTRKSKNATPSQLRQFVKEKKRGKVVAQINKLP